MAEHRIEDLARLAHFSPFHFHRVYAGVVRETVAATVRRATADSGRKRQFAAKREVFGEQSLITIEETRGFPFSI